MKTLVKNQPDYDYVMSLKSFRMNNSAFRNMLHNVERGCYVQCEPTSQYGNVVKIYRNQENVPVCFKVKSDKGIDYIAAEQVTEWIPRRFCLPDELYDEDFMDGSGSEFCFEWEDDDE